jgi:multiple sugar transport system permease protein
MGTGTASLQAVGAPSVPRRRIRWSRVASYLTLLAWSLVVVVPLFWMVTTAFKQQRDLFPRRLVVPFLEFVPKLDAFEYILTDFRGQLTTAFTNSLIAASGSAIAATLAGALAGYGLVRFEYRLGPWRNDQIAFWFVSQRMLPPVAIVFPFLLAFRAIGLADSAIGLMVAYTLFSLPIAVWIMRDAFRSVPLEIEESAYLDGCSRLQTFIRISLPLALPGLMATLLICFILAWNEYVFALILTFQNGQTLPILVAAQATQQGNYFWNMAALSLIAVAPVLVLGIALHRWLVRGLALGGLK